MTRVVVVGAGITGLAAAWRLRRELPDAEVLVLEAGERPGGLVHTSPFDGLPLDTAADAFLARVPDAVALCSELGIADQLVHPTDAGALVLTAEGLRRLPAGLVLGVPTDLEALAASGIVSPAGVERARHDPGPLAAPDDGSDATVDGSAGGDVSVGAMVRHRLGDEVMDELVAPLLGGVNAGDADRLSLAAGAPQLAAVAAAPDLLAALRANAPTPKAPTPKAPGVPSSDAASPPPVFAGFPTGTSTLVDALVARIGSQALHLRTSVTGIERVHGGGFRIGISDGSVLVADAVVLATPAHATAALLATLATDSGDELVDVAHGLAGVEWASVAMVSLAVDTERVAHPLDASGYLVPTARRRTVTAASFASTKWAHLARPGRALLRVSAGHAGDDSPLDLDDGDLTAAICADLGEHLGLDGPPAAVRVTRWRRALPQYRPGHLERAAHWQEEVWSTHPGLWMTGASFAGLGLPACVRQGNEGAARVVAHLRNRVD